MTAEQRDVLKAYYSVETTDEIQPNFDDVKVVAENIYEVITLANGIAADAFQTNADNISSINTVSTNIAGVNAVSNNIDNVNSVAANQSNIDTVATDISNVNSVGANIDNVNSVASNEANINAVKLNETNINSVASNEANINAVADNIADVNIVATDITDVSTVSDNIASINEVSSNMASINALVNENTGLATLIDNQVNVDIVADNISDVNTVVTDIVPNLPEILQAEDNATIATAKANEASTSEANALTYRNEAEAFRNEAETFASDVTYERLDTNGDIGFGVGQVPQGSEVYSKTDTDAKIVELAPTPDLSGLVDKTSDENIGGVKSFTSFPVTPSAAPITDYQVANKKYVDDNSDIRLNNADELYTGEPADIEILKKDGAWIKNQCTAWVNFVGTTTPPTIRDSYNVSQVVRTATGDYDVYFEESMINTNYSVVGSLPPIGTNPIFTPSTRSLNKVRVLSLVNGVSTNSTVTMHIFGGKN